MTRRRKKHRADESVAMLRDADAMLNAGKELAALLQVSEVGDSTLERWRARYGGRKCEEAKKLKRCEEEKQRLKQLVADQALDVQMLKHLSEETDNPFSEASGGGRASHEARRLRAKGMQGG